MADKFISTNAVVLLKTKELVQCFSEIELVEFTIWFSRPTDKVRITYRLASGEDAEVEFFIKEDDAEPS